jgi:hypothetical protein
MRSSWPDAIHKRRLALSTLNLNPHFWYTRTQRLKHDRGGEDQGERTGGAACEALSEEYRRCLRRPQLSKRLEK